MRKKKISYKELKSLFRSHEELHDGTHLEGAIVFTEGSFKKKYPLKSRTYLVSSDNKAYQSNMGGYSIFSCAADGTDVGVRLDWYMQEEKGGSDGWKVDYCYLIPQKKGA